MTRKTAAALLLAAAIVLLSALVAHAVYRPYQGYPGRGKFVLIPRGHRIAQIGHVLEREGVVRSAWSFAGYVRLRYPSGSLKAGEYWFEGPRNAAEVAARLIRGDIYYHRLTIPEGWTVSEIIEEFVKRGFGERERFLDITQQTHLLSDLDPQASDLEGYLFPDTYFITRGTPEEQIIRHMIDRLRPIWTLSRRQRARELGLSVRQVITLASLIEKETAVVEERSLVSAVFHNRLRRNIKLECDPTVIYAVKRVKPFDGVIHQSDLKLDSPYNTYLYPGLPPGPIANPGLDSIDAALYPAEVDYLYFVSRNDGTHLFSRDYRAHHRAVRQYQR